MRINSKKILLILFAALFAGSVLPYLFSAFSAKFVLALGVMALFVMMFIVKKGRITAYDWLILVFLGIPFHDYKITFGNFFIRTTELFFIPFMIWSVVQLVRNKADKEKLFHLHKEYIVLIFFCGFSVVSAILSSDVFISMYRTIILIYLIIMSFLISRVVRKYEVFHLLLKAMIAVSVGASLFAVLQSFIPSLQLFDPVPLIQLGGFTIFRSGVGWQNPNYFALYITLLLPLTYICKISGYFPEKRFFSICFFVQLAGLLCSYSRLGMISICFTFLCLLWVRGKKTIALLAMTVMIFFSALTFMNMEYIYKNHPYLAATVFRIVHYETVAENPLLIAGWRRDAWIANVKMFLSRPLLGVGPFMSTEEYANYLPEDSVFPGETLAVHNEYLSLLSERGLIGTVLFLLFLAFLAQRTLVWYRIDRFSPYGVLMLGLWASVVNFIWFSFGAATIYSVQFWINVGLIFALHDISPRKNEDVDIL